MIWKLCIFTHKNIKSTLFWHIWWKFAYKWVYPFMWHKKAEGKLWAQPFGEGEEGMRRYINDSFIQSLHIGANETIQIQ